ncbi:hypothetical protein EVAR_52640_1 [Eumeta japonica]|uniref:Uncharacterized protein n=1 Tax=Eumeta variegata TaxID=151549 RepID=A0A4C1Y1Q6_EUMVA|nr:hypothetical protein EVAR_52640_1 [Eumeta japonica]
MAYLLRHRAAISAHYSDNLIKYRENSNSGDSSRPAPIVSYFSAALHSLGPRRARPPAARSARGARAGRAGRGAASSINQAGSDSTA